MPLPTIITDRMGQMRGRRALSGYDQSVVADIARSAMGPGGLTVERPTSWLRVINRHTARALGEILSAWGFHPYPMAGRTRLAYCHLESASVLKVAIHPRLGFLAVAEARTEERASRLGLVQHFPRTEILAPGVQWQALVDTRRSIAGRGGQMDYRFCHWLANRLSITDLHDHNWGYSARGVVQLIDWTSTDAWKKVERVFGEVTGLPDRHFV